VRVGFAWADVTTPAPVPLSIQHTGASVVLLWPTNSASFTLQSSFSLTLPVTWSTVPGSPALSGTNYTLTLPATNSTRFFRLVR
jgi:hypothetical protein